MRAIIGGMRYNTDLAERIASASGGPDVSGAAYYEEGLYRTQRGAWFLAGRGNAHSPYGRSFGNGHRAPGERVTPLTDDEAQDWLEAHGEVDALEAYFEESLLDA
jgi:hypothetical protein